MSQVPKRKLTKLYPTPVNSFNLVDKKKYIRGMVKGLLEEEDNSQVFQEGQKNVLTLVNVLMNELQKLKNNVKDQKEEQLLLREYTILSQKHYTNQINELHSLLLKSEESRINLYKNTATILGKLESKKQYNANDRIITIKETQIKELQQLLLQSNKTSFAPSKEFQNIPDYETWAEEQIIIQQEELRKQHEEEEKLREIEERKQELERKEKELMLQQDLESEGSDLEVLNSNDIIMTLIEPNISGYRIENGSIGYNDPNKIIETDRGGIIDHTNYIIDDPEKGIFFISCANTENAKELKNFSTLVRTENGYSILPKQRKKKLIQTLQLNPNTPWKEIKDASFCETLLSLEQKDLSVRSRNKFGVLYVKEGQTQNEMFSNNEGSDDWNEFLSFLGDTIELKGWDKYNGGLDTETDTTGTHSIYLQYLGVEIMFHVSTMIPFSDSDEQQVERKRHLGNDIVVLVFKEGTTPFSPLLIRSHFNTIFIVVQKFKQDNISSYYQVTVASRDGVEPFPPFLPKYPVFKKNKAFRDFLIAKMINAERQTHKSVEFSNRLSRAKSGAMKLIAKNF